MDVFNKPWNSSTLKIRMKEHEQNSIIIAKYLEEQDYIVKLNSPAPTHPQYELAKNKCNISWGFGADFKNT